MNILFTLVLANDDVANVVVLPLLSPTQIYPCCKEDVNVPLTNRERFCKSTLDAVAILLNTNDPLIFCNENVFNIWPSPNVVWPAILRPFCAPIVVWNVLPPVNVLLPVVA